MNFNIYLDDETGQQLTLAARDSGENRNALIRQAIAEWLARHGKPQWPEAVRNFQGIPDMPTFESSRDQLGAPNSDPLA
jgi:hypothetical protein